MGEIGEEEVCADCKNSHNGKGVTAVQNKEE